MDIREEKREGSEKRELESRRLKGKRKGQKDRVALIHWKLRIGAKGVSVS